ncbi:MAG: hypothetical protein JSS57_24115 [Proteobacteria bacterium]|nr:hypothetical protein [Pseudomonadota bacterium]
MKDAHQFQVFADYQQFYLMDAGVEPMIPEEVTEQDMLRRLRTAPHIVVVHAESATHVLVEVAFVSEPTEAKGAWEHQTEFSISFPSGNAVLCGCTDFVPQCPCMSVAPGNYRGRAYFAGRSGGEERYCLVLWPAAVKQFISPDPSRQAVQVG